MSLLLKSSQNLKLKKYLKKTFLLWMKMQMFLRAHEKFLCCKRESISWKIHQNTKKRELQRYFCKSFWLFQTALRWPSNIKWFRLRSKHLITELCYGHTNMQNFKKWGKYQLWVTTIGDIAVIEKSMEYTKMCLHYTWKGNVDLRSSIFYASLLMHVEIHARIAI